MQVSDTGIPNVYPLLSYSTSATIVDADLLPPLAHTDAETGSFIAAALELNAGSDNSSVIITSGSSPYAGYKPMYTSEYYDIGLDGRTFVLQAINYGMAKVQGLNDFNPTIDSPDDIMYYVGETGNVIV